MRRDTDGAVVEVDDDGDGFDPSTVTAGMGLGNLRDRATRLGGEVRISSGPDEGTTVRVLLPM